MKYIEEEILTNFYVDFFLEPQFLSKELTFRMRTTRFSRLTISRVLVSSMTSASNMSRMESNSKMICLNHSS